MVRRHPYKRLFCCDGCSASLQICPHHDDDPVVLELRRQLLQRAHMDCIPKPWLVKRLESPRTPMSLKDKMWAKLGAEIDRLNEREMEEQMREGPDEKSSARVFVVPDSRSSASQRPAAA